jgi:phospholipid/cholesterol/gamma-HCH transport system permease protein
MVQKRFTGKRAGSSFGASGLAGGRGIRVLGADWEHGKAKPYRVLKVHRWKFLGFDFNLVHYNNAMPAVTDVASASAIVSDEGGDLCQVAIGGRWKITGPRPSWSDLITGRKPRRIRLALAELEVWDSSLLLFLFEIQEWCLASSVEMDASALPEKMRELLKQIVSAQGKEKPVDRQQNPLTVIGLAAFDILAKVRQISHFVGECTLATVRLAKNPIRFRWKDCLAEMQHCGAMALPIVGLVGILVGLTMAYTAAVLLREFGADIYVANFVGLVMVREMGPMMTGVILSGRTGASFAATLGNMKAGEEIDAFETLGIRSMDFLVMPRMLAVMLMTPLLTLYANMLGIVGGLMVALAILKIPATAYWVQLQTAVDLSDVISGLIKAATFGGIIGLSGCLRGLESERSAIGVGHATTSAVVTSILLLIVADAIYAVVFNMLGI